MSLRLSALLTLMFVAACARGPAELILATPASLNDEEVSSDRELADDLTKLFGRESDINLEFSDDTYSEESAIDALLAGTVDVALVSNSMPYHAGITTVIPMYPTVLHIGSIGDRKASDLGDLVRGSNVFAGAEGSASRIMFQQSISRLGLREDEFNFIDDTSQRPDVIVVFAPISPDRLRDYPEFRMFSLGPPDSIGTGSIVDAATLLNPFFRPFVIPVGTYGDSTPEPILTLAVDKILVARRGLDSSVVYDLINELIRLRPALSAQNPGLFHGLTGDFDGDRSTFVLHPGAQDFLQRLEPSTYERYSGIAEVIISVLIGIGSAIFAGFRILRIRRKNRIDKFYSETIRLRNTVRPDSDIVERNAVIEEIRALQDTAFELLVEEKLAADESFRIFINLSNDVMAQLGDRN